MKVEFDRDALYCEVWQYPINKLAKKHGLSDNGLRKLCVALAIPLPGRGHWAKVAAGHQLTPPPLPPAHGRTLYACRLPNPDADGTTAPSHEAEVEKKLAFEAAPENAVLVPAELTSPHRLVASAARTMYAERAALHRSRELLRNPPKRKPGARWEPNWEALKHPNWHDYERHGGIMDLSACATPMRVSIETADRALRIWDAIIKACEARGMYASAEHLVVKISADLDHVGLRMSENVDQTKRAVAPGVVPTIVRKATGRLRLFVVHLGETKFEDSPNRPLELQLNAVLVRIHRTLAAQRTERAIAAEKKRIEEATTKVREQERAVAAEAAEAARVHEENMQRLQVEQAEAVERQRLLVAEATAWRDAETIREYLAHLKAAAAADPGLDDWLAWANSVADTLDPTLKRLK